MEGSSQEMWRDYAQRKRAQRMFEANQVWRALVAAGGGAETVLALDFVCFGPPQANVDGLRQQLSENCTATIEDGPDGYRLIKGTTRPYGITLSESDHLNWVDFMCDVAQSHGCVFSTWSLSDSSSSIMVSSESFEGGS